MADQAMLVNLSLADCFELNTNGRVSDYLAVLNFGPQIKYVNLNISDPNMARPYQAIINFYAILGNDNFGEYIALPADDNPKNHCFGAGVNWGERFVPATSLSYTFFQQASQTVHFNFNIIAGGEMERYFFCNSSPIPQVNAYKVIPLNPDTMKSTAYHEMKYMCDSRLVSALLRNECGAMTVSRRSVRISETKFSDELELWCLKGDNGFNAGITHVQTMVAFVGCGAKTSNIFIANALKPANQHTMYYVYLIYHSRKPGNVYEAMEAYTHQL